MIAGVLVVDKPQGLTSHDVVAAVRRALGERRIGHCGTLDPMATGVLALAIGTATRLVQFLSGETKYYDAVVRFGLQTTTHDATGEVVATSERLPTRDALEVALQAFRGDLLQTPPAFSAKKVGGQRAYARARRNDLDATALRPVPVACHELTMTAFDGKRAWLSMAVSAGFYVRALAHDLGQRLGTGAVLDGLRRTRAGDFTLGSAVTLEALLRDSRDALVARLVPLDALLPGVPAVSLTAEEAGHVRHGRDLPVPAGWGTAPPLARLVQGEGLVGLAVPARRPGFLHPSVVLG